MKAALVNSCRFIGGSELWQVRFAKFLKSQGDQAKFYLRPGKFSEHVEKEGFPVIEIAMRSDLDIFSALKFYQEFKAYKPDVVIFNDQRDLRLGSIAAKNAGVPLKIQSKAWSYLKGSFRDRFFYRRIDVVVCVSRAIENLFAEKLNLDQSRLHYLPYGIDLERFQGLDKKALRKKVGAGDDEFLLGMTGRMVKQKRQSDLIRAAKALCERGHKLKVVLAGEGKDRPGLEDLARELGLTERVIFLGFVEKIEEFLADLDIFVFCSEQEGMPNAVLEALASGTPVIAASIPGVDELIESGKNGLLYPVGDVPALAGSIESLLNGKISGPGLGKAAVKRIAENFDERKIFTGFREWLIQKSQRG
jgi:glycosyltransferase involved in cell wall biosynthesis